MPVATRRILYVIGVAKAAGQEPRRHAWRNAATFMRTLCSGPDWNVKVRDDESVPFCGSCLHIAREEITATAAMLVG